MPLPNAEAMRTLSEKADSSAKWFAIAIGFSVPISVALDNILMLAVAVFWLASGHFREKFETVRRNRVALSALALILLLALGMFYGEASWHDAFGTFGKYIDLLFVPVFLTLFRDDKARRRALAAFVFSMLLTLFLSYLLRFGMLHQNSILRGFAGNPFVFKLHITQNFFMSFASLVLGVWAFHETDRKRRILWGILSILALVNVLFMVQGRIGYIVLALLLLYLFVRKLGKKGLLAGMAATLLLGSLAYYGSKEFHERISIASAEFAHWRAGSATKDTDSIGQRLEFYANTMRIVGEHPFFGAGTGGFEKAYAAQVAGTGMIATRNPHDEFLLITVQLGLPGLILLLYLFGMQWREARSLPLQEQCLAHGLVIAMVSGCLFNSFLLDHAEGLFFSWMTGALFSAKEES